MKKIVVSVLMFCLSIISFGQIKDDNSTEGIMKQFVNNKDTIRILQNKNVQEVKEVLMAYKNAIEKLDAIGTEKFFTADSKIYESGSTEGNYQDYLKHHLIPELKEFKSFVFNSYKIEVQLDGKYAFASETYNYTIIIAKDNSAVKLKGIATSVLKKIKGEWKIMISHNSSRK